MEPDPRELEVAREVLGRALRRLSAAEYGVLFLAVAMALGGGALVAWLLGSLLGLPFRGSWVVASLLLFVVPGGVAYVRELRPSVRRGGGPSASGPPGGPDSNLKSKDPHG